jgi:hypothetical protein
MSSHFLALVEHSRYVHKPEIRDSLKQVFGFF